jgi:hypothetical protein
MFDEIKIILWKKRKVREYNNWQDIIETIFYWKNKVAIQIFQGFKWLVEFQKEAMKNKYRLKKIIKKQIAWKLFHIYEMSPIE